MIDFSIMRRTSFFALVLFVATTGLAQPVMACGQGEACAMARDATGHCRQEGPTLARPSCCLSSTNAGEDTLPVVGSVPFAPQLGSSHFLVPVGSPVPAPCGRLGAPGDPACRPPAPPLFTLFSAYLI